MRRRVGPLLRRLGIQPDLFWLLSDLFQTLSERRELFAQLGREGMALKSAALLYFVFASVGSMLWSLAQPQAGFYLTVFLGYTAFLLFTILLMETGNSLVNATEGLVLAHQPINGATYTAAKLTHLLRIVGYLALGFNAVPSLVGLVLPGATWTYPLRHLALAFAVGLAMALVCCSLYGWLLRFIPSARLKAITPVLEVAPFLVMSFLPQVVRKWGPRLRALAPEDPTIRIAIAGGLTVLLLGAIVFGLRSLSGDFLIRLSTLVHGGNRPAGKRRGASLGERLAAWAGGQAARAGHAYTGRMMLRDWQFRRHLLPVLPALLLPLLGMLREAPATPFSREFSAVHGLPHLVGGLLFWSCSLMVYGNQPKAGWVFLLAPSGALQGFARGVWALLLVYAVLLPNLLVFPPLVWVWGWPDALLFSTYSLALSSVYLTLVLRLIEGIPFTRPLEAGRNVIALPLLMGAGLAMAIAIGLQWVLVFRSREAVVVVTLGLVATAYRLHAQSMVSLEAAMRHGLAVESNESGRFYQEIET